MPREERSGRTLRRLIAIVVVVAAAGGGYALWPRTQPPVEPPIPISPVETHEETIRVAAFNIQVFGRTKAGKPEVMEILAKTAREFDLVVVQEFREAAMEVADDFLARINEEPGEDYEMYEGPRLGRTSSKEQYAAYYLPSRVQLLSASTYPDPDDVFEREPLVASFRAGNFDFTLLVCHIKPDSASAELAHMATAARSLLESNPSEQDIILLGDFNADGRYLDEDDMTHALRDSTFHWVIGNEMDTMTRTDWTYDRIILLAGTYYNEYVDGSAGVFYFNQEYDLTDQEFVEDVSDHFPVYAVFIISGPDDDGP